MCYSNDTLLKLRNGVGADGDYIGANFDPSHLWWQGIDPIAAVRQLGREGALFHVHAKDTRIDPSNSGRNGNLDTKSYGDINAVRSWVFRSVGYGHTLGWWKDFCSALRMAGYDFVLQHRARRRPDLSPTEGRPSDAQQMACGGPAHRRRAGDCRVRQLIIIELQQPASASTASMSATALKTATISGTAVVTNAGGFTLYWFAPDTATKSNCNGSCAVAGEGTSDRRGPGHRHARHRRPL